MIYEKVCIKNTLKNLQSICILKRLNDDYTHPKSSFYMTPLSLRTNLQKVKENHTFRSLSAKSSRSGTPTHPKLNCSLVRP